MVKREALTEAELKEYRPIPFYFITTADPEELSYDAVRRAMITLKEEGFGGIVLFNKPPHGFSKEEYLSKAWFDMIRTFAIVCRELKLRLWINNAYNYPPGTVGGRIAPEKYPHLTQKKLVLQGDTVSVEEVAWGFPAFEEEESVKLFISLVYEVYLREVGEYFNDPICGFFSDADNRRVNYRVFSQTSPQRNYFPWSNGFAGSFEKKYGYDIRPYLPAILRREVCSQAVDYWEHAGWLYQGWFRENYRWCHEHGLEYTFHTSDSSPFVWEEAPRCSVFTEGRALDMENNCDYPGTDQELLEINGGKHMRQQEMWTPKVSWAGDDAYVRNPEYYKVYGDLRAKQAGSCAFLHHKKGAMCEMFAASNWGATYTRLREIAAWQIMQGINFIVPHAYHYRFHGNQKYFAPPIFMEKSTLNYGAKQLNDVLSTYCYYTSQGRLKAPIAVLDITDGLWEHRTIESHTLFMVCEQLNRMPYGYVLADVKSILANREEFRVIINAGASLSERMKQALISTKLPILEMGSWDNPSMQKEEARVKGLVQYLKEHIECSVFYQGEGKPHFMRRCLEDGRELVALANIEDGRTITGTLHIGTATFEVVLRSGEISFYMEDGVICADPVSEQMKHLKNQEHSYLLPQEVPVIWEQENLIPIEYWTDELGHATSKSSDARIRHFDFIVDNPGISSVKLLLSKKQAENICSLHFNGEILSAKEEIYVYDDPYICYVLEITEGKHRITLKNRERLVEYDRILLQGEFGVKVEYEEPYAVCFLSQYCQDNYIPSKARITLSKRPSVLQTKTSWAEQGHPFYSGKVTYCFDIQLPEDFGKAVLYLPQVAVACDIKLDGKAIGQRIFSPYAFEMGNMGGSHQLHITVCNTMANSMEGYKALSGITAGAFLIR